MKIQANLRKPEVLAMIRGAAAVLVLGLGTATAAISVASTEQINPAMRPLASGPSLHVQAAFGEDDEDCVWVTAKTVQPNGKIKLVRKLECVDEP